MKHAEPQPDDAGTFADWARMERPCPRCGSGEFFWTTWESKDGAYVDEKQHCRTCGFVHWIDGIDS